MTSEVAGETRRNLLLQREPLDWWVAVQSARRAKDAVALGEIESAIQAAGLRDLRLAAVQQRTPAPAVKASR